MYFYIDSYNICRVKRNNLKFSDEIIADFLEEDVMGVENNVDLIIDNISQVQNGKIEIWEGTGNAHTISITKDKINIFNEFTEMEVTIYNFGYFLSLLYQWKKLIESRTINQT